MNKLIIVILSILLGGCGLLTRKCEDQPITVQYKYIVNQVPDELLVIPEYQQNLNVTSATDKDAAIWILEQEKRMKELELRLKSIKEYQVNKLKSLNLPEADIIK